MRSVGAIAATLTATAALVAWMHEREAGAEGVHQSGQVPAGDDGHFDRRVDSRVDSRVDNGNHGTDRPTPRCARLNCRRHR